MSSDDNPANFGVKSLSDPRLEKLQERVGLRSPSCLCVLVVQQESQTRTICIGPVSGEDHPSAPLDPTVVDPTPVEDPLAEVE